jgi:hypothetical protein
MGHVPPKRRLKFNGLHGVISQDIERFIPTSVTLTSYKRPVSLQRRFGLGSEGGFLTPTSQLAGARGSVVG